MVVNHESEVVVSSGVDKTQAVFLASLKDGLEAGSHGIVVSVGSVDETVNCSRRATGCSVGNEFIRSLLRSVS